MSLNEKKLLLAKRMNEKKKEGSAVTVSQQALWYIYKSSPESNAYNQYFAAVIKGNLNARAFTSAFEKTIYKHTELRAKFIEKDGTLYKYLDEKTEGLVTELNAENWSEEEIKAKVNELVKRPFVLEEGRLFRVYLLLNKEPVLVIVTHHIVVDLWSMGIIIKDMKELYTGLCSNKAVPERKILTYTDYTIWQNLMLNTNEGKKQENYWIQKLKGYTQIIDIAKLKREGIPNYKGGIYTSMLSKDITGKLRMIARKENTTLYVVLVALYHILLYKYTAVDDITIGSSVAGRNNPKFENTVGYFVNLLPIRTQINSSESFPAYLTRVKETVLESLEHQDYPFSKILEQVEVPVKEGFSHLIQAAFSMEAIHNTSEENKEAALFAMSASKSAKMQFADLLLESIEVEAQDTPYDLLLKAEAGQDTIHLSWQFNSSIAELQDMKDMARHFGNLAASVAFHTNQQIKEIHILDEKDYKLLFEEVNPKAQEYDGRLFLEEFKATCKRYPNNKAVTMGKASVTYEELDKKSSHIAYALNRSGITKEKPVGVCLNKSIEAIEILLGILKAGGVYTPIDPQYPDERIDYIAKDSGMGLMITEEGESKRFLPELTSMSVSELLIKCEAINMTEYQGVTIKPQDAAYLIYTSGSTGKPKGVLIEHIGICNLVDGLNQGFGVDSESRLLQFASFSFDASVAEIFTALLVGAELIMAKKEDLYPGVGLERLLKEHAITEVILTPSVLKLTNPRGLTSLKTVMSAGESCSLFIIKKWSKYCRFINAYGPTENTVCATLTECNSEDNNIHIGKGIKNTKIYILDKDGNPVPFGMKGELCISSIGLARCYVNNETMTADRFIPNKIDKDAYERIYRTGDYASFLKDGNINFIGRMDNQIKIRGFRIELNEIENCLNTCEFVKESAVLVKEDKDGLKRLIAFVSLNGLPDDGTGNSYIGREHEKPVKEHVKKNLPFYMVPSAFVFLPELPHNVSEKIDRNKLAQMELHNPVTTQSDRVLSSLQSEIMKLWEEALFIKDIELEDNFLELGGHSLLIAQLLGKIRSIYQINLSVADIYKNLVLQDMCNLIESRMNTGMNKISPIVSHNQVSEIPVTYAQRQLLFLEELGMGGSVYNIAGSILIKGDLDFEAMEKAFVILVNKHDILKTTFHKRDNSYVQEVRNSVEAQIKRYKMETDFTRENLEHFLAQLNKELFDLSKDLLIRANLLFLRKQEYILNFAIHHSVGDGLSVMNLTQEWSDLYKKTKDRIEVQTTRNEFQYSDFAIWQQENIQGEVLTALAEYWTANLEGTQNKYLSLETDYVRPDILQHTGASIRSRIPENTYALVKNISRQTNTTVYMVMLAAFYVLLYKHTDDTDINIGTPISGRNLPEVQDMIGMFINTVVIRAKLKEHNNFGELLTAIKKTVTDALNHQDMPFEKLVEYMKPDRNISHSPLFQVMFNMLTVKTGKFELEGLDTEEFANTSQDSKYDFTLYVSEDSGGIGLELLYNTALFTREHMKALLEQYKIILSKLKTDFIISEISLLEEENSQQSIKLAMGQSEYSRSLLGMFADCAAAMPEKEALKGDEVKLSYQEVDIISSMLAVRLKEKGLGEGNCIGIYADRGSSLPIALLAALKISSDFAIMDSAYPAERLLSYMDELHMDAMILCSFKLDRRMMRELEERKTVWLVYDRAELLYDKENLPYEFSFKDYLKNEKKSYYYTFTSGTMGKPQLIKSCIRSVAHFIQWYIKEFSYDRESRFGMLSGLAHDPLIRDIFTPLCCGGCLYVPEFHIMDTDRLEQWINQNRITVIHQTPSFIRMLKGRKLPSVKQICLGGELLTGPVIGVLNEIMPLAEIINCYGASETPQIMAYYMVNKDGDLTLKRIPIGKGIDKTELYIMNQQEKETGLYEAGEIWIRSEYLSEGYVNHKELTDRKFVVNPFTKKNGDFLYKTGDNGYRLSDGTIVCKGRTDRQAKIRGFRVEIGEIEEKISAFKEVKEVRAIADKDSITAYLVLQKSSMVSERELSDRLKVILPVYMIPGRFVFIDEIPINQNGKIDDKKLRNYVTESKNDMESKNEIESMKSLVASTEAETITLGIWKEVLKREDINIYDNFFDAGGHSLLLSDLHNKLKKAFSLEFNMLELFQYPNISSFVKQVIDKDKTDLAIQKKKEIPRETASGEIAVIGMSGRFPKAENIDKYWDMIKHGREAITYLSEDELRAEGISEELLKDPKYIKAAMLLEDYDKFDADFFDMNPREAEIMDPQQKIFLEECYHALESAGYTPDNYEGKIGVFGGSSMNSYMIHNLIHNKDFILSNQELTHSFIHGNINDYLCTRVAYKMNLRGPAVTVQSACSTSMAAVHFACQSLRNKESDMVLAGGVTVKIPNKEGYYYVDGGIFSRDGHCRPFDDDCTGTIFGSGAGVIVLKRLEDAVYDGDTILAVIKGSGLNNDGSSKVGYTASSITGESSAIRQAIENSGVAVEHIGYLEAHGTGTRMGDPIEIKALDTVYKEYTKKTKYCVVGSVKANIGHLNAASGIASLIKTILILQHGEIPPSVNFHSSNKAINFSETPFYINRTLKKWEGDEKRIAGVSSFGMGGTNVHVILENYQEVKGQEEKGGQVNDLEINGEEETKEGDVNG